MTVLMRSCFNAFNSLRGDVVSLIRDPIEHVAAWLVFHISNRA